MRKKFNFYYFLYFKKFIGFHIYIFIVINFFVGLLDSMGLAMFIPLLSLASNENSSEKINGWQEFLIKLLQFIGFELNIFSVLILMLLLFLMKGAFSYARSIYLIKIRLVVLKKTRVKLIEGLKEISYEGITKISAGKLQGNMVVEIGKMLDALMNYFKTIQNVVMLVTYILFAFFSDWMFAVMVGAGGLLTNIFFKYINKIIKNYATEQVGVSNNFNNDLIQSIQNFKYLKATNSFIKFEHRLKKDILKGEQISYSLGKFSSIAENLREPLIMAIITLVIIIQIKVFNSNFSAIAVSLLLLYRSLAYLVTMQSAWSSFISQSAGIDSVEGILKEFETHKEKLIDSKILKISDFELNGVCVKFGDKKVLNNLTLSFKKNTSNAFVGESGAGKTTLINVLSGLLKPYEGKVVIDHQSLYDTNLNYYRNKIGYITQEPVIFNDTLYNNVTFFAEKTPENLKKFWDAITFVSLKDYVESLQEKEETSLGHNGILISGGQKQRISIARELFKDVEILIFDEATSALDSSTEKEIQTNIDALNGKYTIFIIAHRLSTIKNVDQIYVMNNGEIIEQGKYEELIVSSHTFRNMVELQRLH